MKTIFLYFLISGTFGNLTWSELNDLEHRLTPDLEYLPCQNSLG